MKQLITTLALTCLLLAGSNNLPGQNPNWVLPGSNYQPGIFLGPLPQSPAWPPGYNPGGQGSYEYDYLFRYEGDPAQYTQAGYTGSDGQLMCFVVDGRLYDKDGWLVNFFRDVEVSNITSFNNPKGFGEMLILPMGNSCSQFAIIYTSTQSNTTHPINAWPHVYMAIYDTEAANTLNPFAKGSLVGQGVEGLGATVQSISDFFKTNHSTPGLDEFGKRSGFQIAATELIDNCYRYVLLCDGMYMFRYKLDDSGLHYDDYSYQYHTSGGAPVGSLRSEMDLIQLGQGSFRVAIPFATNSGNDPGRGIRIFDLNTDMEVIAGTSQLIDLSTGSFLSDPYGLEFDASGRYLYFTHSQSSTWTKPIDIWDVQTASVITPSTPSTFNPFRNSFIERFGNNLYLAKSTHLGIIGNSTGALSNWTPEAIAINPGYGNNANQGSIFFRYILPAQVNDDTYGDFADLSCNCCRDHSSGIDKYTSENGFHTWNQNNNPLNNGTGPNAYVKTELRIKRGSNVIINNMNVHFGPQARVIIERGLGSQAGGRLTINGTTFTADLRCSGKTFDCCESNTPPPPPPPVPTATLGEMESSSIPDPPQDPQECPCAAALWTGVVVEGRPNEPQTSSRQGRFTMRNNSVIEFAQVGILVGPSSSFGGGVLNLHLSELKDNKIGIRFNKYNHGFGTTGWNHSAIRRVSFRTTQDLFDLGHGPHTRFVWLSNVNGVSFHGCTFNNEYTQSNALSTDGNGIYSFRSGLRVLPYCEPDWTGSCTYYKCQFYNINHAINVNNFALNWRQAYVGYSLFDNVNRAIYFNNTTNASALDNTIRLNPFGTLLTGIELIASTGYKVENNNIRVNPSAGIPNSNGIKVTSSGTQYNRIYRNTFTRLQHGINAFGINGAWSQDLFSGNGLQFLCNTFNAPLSTNDIIVTSGIVNPIQGNCFSENGPAGNLFSHSGSWHVDYMLNTTQLHNSFTFLLYYHNPLPPLRLLPNQYLPVNGSPQYGFIQCPQTYSSQTSCPVINSGDPRATRLPRIAGLMNEDGEFVSDLVSLISQFADEIEESIDDAEASLLASSSIFSLFDTLSTSASLDGNVELSLNSSDADSMMYLQSLYLEQDEYWQEVVDMFQTDTTGALGPAVMFGLLNDHKVAAYERLTASLAYFLNVPEPTWISPENSLLQMVSIPLGLDSTGVLPEMLPEMFPHEFLDSHSNVSMLNLHYNAQLLTYTPFEEEDLTFALEEPKSEIQEDKKLTEGLIKAYPNPFNNQINLLLDESLAGYNDLQVHFFDLTGRMVQQSRYGNGDKLIVIDGHNLPTGMLFFTVQTDGKQVHSGKLMHLK